MFKKLLFCLVAITACNNLVYGSEGSNLKKTDCVGLKGALLGSASGFLWASANAGLFFRDKACMLFFGRIGLALGFVAGGISTYLPTDKYKSSLAIENPTYQYILIRARRAGTIIGALTGAVALGCCLKGFTAEDFR